MIRILLAVSNLAFIVVAAFAESLTTLDKTVVAISSVTFFDAAVPHNSILRTQRGWAIIVFVIAIPISPSVEVKSRHNPLINHCTWSN